MGMTWVSPGLPLMYDPKKAPLEIPHTPGGLCSPFEEIEQTDSIFVFFSLGYFQSQSDTLRGIDPNDSVVLQFGSFSNQIYQSI